MTFTITENIAVQDCIFIRHLTILLCYSCTRNNHSST